MQLDHSRRGETQWAELGRPHLQLHIVLHIIGRIHEGELHRLIHVVGHRDGRRQLNRLSSVADRITKQRVQNTTVLALHRLVHHVFTVHKTGNGLESLHLQLHRTTRD